MRKLTPRAVSLMQAGSSDYHDYSRYPHPEQMMIQDATIAFLAHSPVNTRDMTVAEALRAHGMLNEGVLDADALYFSRWSAAPVLD